jgi:predicted MPP superfamily phosphohydrolase
MDMMGNLRAGVILGVKINLIIAFLILIFLFISIFIFPNLLTITHNEFDLFSGNGEMVKIAFISDIHVLFEKTGKLEEIVGKINEQKPDLILIGGDFIEGGENEFDALTPLAKLRAPYGVYGLLGNHDYGSWGCPHDSSLADKLVSFLGSMNVTVLRNQNRVLDINGKRFALIGLDDDWVCRNDYGKASAGLDPGMPKIILAHNQLAAEPAGIEGKSLILSGHTHCGLINLPFITQAVLGPAFGSDVGGRERLDDDTELYVTCGTTGGLMRFLTSPEISVIDVR